MKFDTIIIGAGVIGTCIAYHLQRQALKQKILLVDKFPKVAGGNTSRSAALYRNLFSSQTSQILSTSSITFYESIAKQIAIKNLGYLWLFSKDDWKNSQKGLEKLEKNFETYDILTPSEIPKNIALNYDASESFPEIYHAIYGYRCGSLSATKLANYYADKFEKLGGRILLETEIVKLNLSEKEKHYPPWAKIKMISITDQTGRIFSANNFIFSTGAWTNDLLAPIGIASQIYPMKRQMFTIKLTDVKQFASEPTDSLPILILPAGGVYVKPNTQNKILMVGCANELGNPYQITNFPPRAEEGYFVNVIKPVLQYYFPKLKSYQLFSKWAGYYAYFWPDKNPVVEKVSNIQWTSGTSGSGIMKADAIGRIAAAKALGEKKAELYDKTMFTVANLSLKKRSVDTEELII